MEDGLLKSYKNLIGAFIFDEGEPIVVKAVHHPDGQQIHEPEFRPTPNAIFERSRTDFVDS